MALGLVVFLTTIASVYFLRETSNTETSNKPLPCYLRPSKFAKSAGEVNTVPRPPAFRITCLTPEVQAGGLVTLRATAAQTSKLEVAVLYPNASQPVLLTDKTAQLDRNYYWTTDAYWTWAIPLDTPVGEAKIVLTETLDGSTGKDTATFFIVR